MPVVVAPVNDCSHGKKIISHIEVKSSPGQLLLFPLLFSMWCLVYRGPLPPWWSPKYQNSVAVLYSTEKKKARKEKKI